MEENLADQQKIGAQAQLLFHRNNAPAHSSAAAIAKLVELHYDSNSRGRSPEYRSHRRHGGKFGRSTKVLLYGGFKKVAPSLKPVAVSFLI
ncbi:hypothetical protein QE152_g23452 [Popillia japonica]|uniref:Uncharacterized protein n=1 Tax=Popillia japonica TaxID=7064 RepID=A0AAW1KHF9_POPJA